MINGGNEDMAKQILEQYTMLNSNDPEIQVIKSMLYPDGKSTETEDKAIPDEYEILNNIETIFILSGLITRRTGYIDSVLRKIKLMEDKWNYKPVLLTCIHNIDQRQALTWLQTADDDRFKMSAGTRVINVFDYFQKSYADGLASIAVYAPANDGANYVKTSDNTYDVFDADVCIRKEYYTGYAGCLRMIRYFQNGKREKDLIYDDWGYLNYSRSYDPDDDNKFHIDYYTTDGILCIKAFFKFTDEGAMPDKYIVYDQTEAVIRECEGSAELAAFYLSKTITGSKFYMLIVEDGLMSKAATMVESEKINVAKCAVVHSIFQNDAYNPKSGPQMYYKYLCENHKKFDSIIMLTQSAKKDFQEIYGKMSNIDVIPHPYPYEIRKADIDVNDRKNAVIIARLDPLKQINLAVDVFSLVVQKIPYAKLEIYGHGPEKKRLEEQIKKLKLENNVFLRGYTDAPLQIFKNAALSVFTSAAEGFGLTLVESICNGCPAFAFDIKYGPSEIIDDGKTGYLIPNFNKEKFAGKIVRFYEDKQLQKTMSENCYSEADRFSTEKFLNNWYKMTLRLYGKYKA
jgi:poly(glycerol-phosphate) alpha-glucosyltransferase